MNLLCERDVLNKMGWPSGQKPTNPKDRFKSCHSDQHFRRFPDMQNGDPGFK